MDGRVGVSFEAPSHDAEHRSRVRGKGAMSEHRDGRVRAGARPARSAGQSSQPDVGETVMPGANGFGYFCRNKSSPRAAASGILISFDIVATGSRPAPG